VLAEAGLLAPEGARARPVDLVVAVRADSEAAARAARAAAERALAGEGAVDTAASAAGAPPRTLATALVALPGASLAVISVPGLYAGLEARRALSAGLDVMIFSDNVPLETEVALKRQAAARGRLVMGPDCGTAILQGVPLGFANAVPAGRIGLVAASGTGLQEVSCIVAALGEGVSQAIGVGSRDLSDAVGGTTAVAAIAALAADAATAVIVVIGKPPGAATAGRLAAALAGAGKPCVLHFAGARAPDAPAGVHVAATLEDAAHAAVALARGGVPRTVEWSGPATDVERLVQQRAAALLPGQRYVRGVYAGGTLAWEALAILRAALPDVAPDVTTPGPGHRVMDLGDDRFTVGRPHPMLDGALRREWIAREAQDAATAVLLLDVVAGHGAPPDPAGEILPAVRAATTATSGPLVVASVTGTERDPQPRPAQVAALRAAGVIVMDSNAQAARLAARIAARARG
jgi:FdrA protein